MPPRPKYTRAEIIRAAFHLTEKQGIDALTARSIALEMDYTCSSLFTHFKSMEELRQEVFALAKQTMIDYLTECVHYQPAFKEFGLRWVRFARDHSNLYQLLLGHGSELIRNPKDILPALGTLVPTVLSGIMQSFDFTEKEAMELLTQMLIHGNGIAAFIISGYRNLTQDDIGQLLSNACIGIVMTIKARNGALNPELAATMAHSAGNVPIPC